MRTREIRIHPFGPVNSAKRKPTSFPNGIHDRAMRSPPIRHELPDGLRVVG